MQGTKEVSLNDTNYTFTQMPPTRALKVLNRIIKMVGPGVAQIWAGKGLDAGTDEAIPKVVQGLCNNMDEDKVIALIKDEIMDTVLIGGAKGSKVFDNHFTGKLGEMFKVMGIALEHNYKDFLSETVDNIREWLADLRAKHTTPES